MCLINFAYKYHPNYPLIVAANRDEFYNRPTEKANFWQDARYVLAGRDLKEGGTWMGITQQGRFAALTNYRETYTVENTKSRGKIVSDFLCGTDSPEHYLRKLEVEKHNYNGFNLLVGDRSCLLYYSNRKNEITELLPGIYGLSNEFLDSSWPKVSKGKKMLDSHMQESSFPNVEALFKGLLDTEKAPNHLLPDTGVGEDLERNLSPLFIKMEHYGTRSSTIVTIDNNERATFSERTYYPNDNFEDRAYTFQIVRR